MERRGWKGWWQRWSRSGRVRGITGSMQRVVRDSVEERIHEESDEKRSLGGAAGETTGS
jgi:hypothetical protein